MQNKVSAHFVLFLVLCFVVQTVSAALLPCMHSGQNPQDKTAIACPHHAQVNQIVVDADVSMQDCQRCNLDKAFSSVALPDLVRVASIVTMHFELKPQISSDYQSIDADLLLRPPHQQYS